MCQEGRRESARALGGRLLGVGAHGSCPLPASAFPVNQDAIPLVRLGTGEKVWGFKAKGDKRKHKK